MSQDTLTDSLIDLRERVREKRIRAFRALRGMLKIIGVWKQHQKKPIIGRFQRAVRRLMIARYWCKIAYNKRRYKNIANPRASKAIYRLMMLVRMKLRNTSAGEWRAKWRRASLKIKGVIAIQRVVKFERTEKKIMKQL